MNQARSYAEQLFGKGSETLLESVRARHIDGTALAVGHHTS
jgi:hypothetical protein